MRKFVKFTPFDCIKINIFPYGVTCIPMLAYASPRLASPHTLPLHHQNGPAAKNKIPGKNNPKRRKMKKNNNIPPLFSWWKTLLRMWQSGPYLRLVGLTDKQRGMNKAMSLPWVTRLFEFVQGMPTVDYCSLE
ncbi:hypothetical protein INT44_007245 [Umbelopsis vinacea]|uniref:Uncharacterized protein n=1 Tax=Umbelopsis vinacea TaxID=44442 RepID=A0A8H7PM74_9FUNG|nr:hypothetical protein INT44_007245 [Umbelopsis vinacea]